jgi:hypothetical protein
VQYADTFDTLVRPHAAKVRGPAGGQTTASTANGGEPQPALNRVRLSMVRSGDAWLVDDITSY